MRSKGIIAMLFFICTIMPFFGAIQTAGAQENTTQSTVTAAVYGTSDPLQSSADSNTMAALTVIGSNLFLNPGFESVTDGKADDWSATWNSGNFLISSNSHSGNNSLEVLSGNFSQVIDVYGGKPYEAAAWAQCTATRQIQMKVEYYKDTINTAGYLGDARKFVDITTVWQQYSMDDTAPAEANLAKYYFFTGSDTSTCYFDDMSAYRLQQIPGVNVLSNHVIYYGDEVQGTLYGTVWPDDDNSLNKVVDVNIAPQDGGRAIVDDTGIPLPRDGNFTYTFNPERMTLHQGYTATVTLKDDQGAVLYSGTQNLYRWERPTMMREDGTLIVDGEPFFPTMGYHVPIADYPNVTDTINTVHTVDTSRSQQNNGVAADIASIETQLDAAEESGLKVVLPLYIGDKGVQYAKDIVTAIKDHPALLAYYLGDEPDIKNKPLDEMEDNYVAVRSVDSVHPVYIVVNSEAAYKTYGRYCDILGEDIYPLPSAIKPVGHAVHHAKELFPDRAVWGVLQTFTMNGWPYLPTITEVRNMAYQALMEGAEGLSYYSFTDPGWDLRTSVLYPDLVQFNAQEIPYIAKFATNGTIIDSYKNDNVQWAVWNSEGQVYVVGINFTDGQQQMTVTIPYQGYLVNTVATNHAVTNMLGGQLTITNAAKESTLMQLTPYSTFWDQAVKNIIDSVLQAQDNGQ